MLADACRQQRDLGGKPGDIGGAGNALLVEQSGADSGEVGAFIVATELRGQGLPGSRLGGDGIGAYRLFGGDSGGVRFDLDA